MALFLNTICAVLVPIENIVLIATKIKIPKRQKGKATYFSADILMLSGYPTGIPTGKFEVDADLFYYFLSKFGSKKLTQKESLKWAIYGNTLNVCNS